MLKQLKDIFLHKKEIKEEGTTKDYQFMIDFGNLIWEYTHKTHEGFGKCGLEIERKTAKILKKYGLPSWHC